MRTINNILMNLYRKGVDGQLDTKSMTDCSSGRGSSSAQLLLMERIIIINNKRLQNAVVKGREFNSQTVSTVK